MGRSIQTIDFVATHVGKYGIKGMMLFMQEVETVGLWPNLRIDGAPRACSSR